MVKSVPTAHAVPRRRLPGRRSRGDQSVLLTARLAWHVLTRHTPSPGMISTALRTGNPLPQITPCPLLDRFMVNAHGLNVIRQEEDDDYGLPRTMTIDTLENEQYLCDVLPFRIREVC